MTTPPYLDPRDAVFDVSALRADLGRRTGRSAMTVIIFALVKLIFTLGTTAILARFVLPAEQGLFAIAVPAVLIASSLSEFGLAQVIVQREVVTHRLATTLFWINVGLGLLLGGCVALLSGPAAAFYGKPEVAVIFIGLAPYVLFLVLTTQYVSILRRQMRIKMIEMTNLVALVLASSLAIVAGYYGAGLWALVIQLVLNPALTFLFLLVLVGWHPSFPRLRDLGEARSALAFGGFLTLERLMGELARNVQVIILGRYFAEAQAGLFYRSRTFADMPGRRIGAPLSGAFIPALSRLQSEPQAYRDMYLRQVTRANLIIVPCGLALVLCADGVVQILLGPDWVDAGPVLQWLGLTPIAAMTLSSLSWALVSCGASKQIFYYRMFSASIVTITSILSSYYGFMAMIIAVVLVPIVVNAPVMMWVTTRHTPLDWTTFGKIVGAELLFVGLALAMGFGLRALLDWPVLWECVATGGLVCALLGIRIVTNPGLRRDVLSALNRRRS